MAEKNAISAEETVQNIKWGVTYFVLFVIFVASGIFVKRVLHHPEFMMMFHLPAAVFLVLAGKKITVRLKQQYQQQMDSKSQF